LEEDAAHGVALGVGGNSTSFGAVAHVFKGFDLIYNRSNNFTIPTPGVYVFTGNGVGPSAFSLMPPPTGQGEEYGIAFTLPGNRLYAKLVRFTSTSKNSLGFSNSQDAGSTNQRILDTLLAAHLITQADYDSHGGTLPVNGYLVDRTDDGYELSVTANITPNWRFQANYSINEPNQSSNRQTDLVYWTQAKAYFAQFPQTAITTKNVSIAQDIANTDLQIATAQVLNGVGIDGFRKYKANFFTRYAFKDGFLRNAFIGGGYVYGSQMLIGRLGTYSIYGGKTGSGNAVVGYRLKITEKHALDIQLNVFNVFNEIAPLIFKANTNISGPLLLPTHYQYRDPRTWRLSADYTF
jgi:outer membrane receptor for monomeric catechols